VAVNQDVKTKPSLFISGDINEDTLMRVLPFLHGNLKKEVQIFLCSNGGDSKVGLEIYKLFKAHKKVTCIAIGYCNTIATLMLVGANKRAATIDCEFLIHYGLTKVHTAHEAEVTAKIHKDALNIYRAELPNLTEEKLTQYMNSDIYMNFQEAVDLGLIQSEYKL